MQWVATRPLYCQGFLAAFGGTGIADNYSGCSEYANDLPVIVDEDGNYYDRFSVANSLGIQIPIFEDNLSIPQLLRARFEGQQQHSLPRRYRQRGSADPKTTGSKPDCPSCALIIFELCPMPVIPRLRRGKLMGFVGMTWLV
jgi:hypothetical protein